MGQRRESRVETRVPVRIFGTDASGRPFSENVFTVNVSREGARISGMQALIKSGEIIGLSYKQNKGRYVVKWVGQMGTPQAGEIGLFNATPGKFIWDFELPDSGVDPHRFLARGERRKHPRVKCSTAVELRVPGEPAPVRAKAVDLSLGGCFVELPVPLKLGTNFEVVVWIAGTKLVVNARVASSSPGFGIGVAFREMSAEDTDRLRCFLENLAKEGM
jgi:PilZ domain-containing protein